MKIHTVNCEPILVSKLMRHLVSMKNEIKKNYVHVKNIVL